MLQFNRVGFFFCDTGFEYLNISELDVYPGINYVVGRNGAGKSSFLHALSGIYPNSGYSGEIRFSGRASGPTRFGLITQNPEDSVIPDLTFLENLIFASVKGLGYLSLRRLVTRTKRQFAEEYVNHVGVHSNATDLFDRPAKFLSGGEKQLLAILMRSYRGGDVLLLDEVTANLDEQNAAIVMGLVTGMAKNGKVILFATHQFYLTEEYPGCVYVIKNKGLKRVESLRNLPLVDPNLT